MLESAAGYKVFADMRMELGEHLRKMPMGYFTEGNLGQISSVLSTDMVFIEENCMGVLSELVSFIISQGLMNVFMFVMDVRLGLLSLFIVAVFVLIGNLMLKTTLKHSVIKQEDSESLTEEELFPFGVPAWEVEEIKIRQNIHLLKIIANKNKRSCL